MKAHIFLLLLALVTGSAGAQDAEEKSIRSVLARQEAAWNKGDIDEFMEGYWKSDSLKFIGASITKGWKATLERYRKTYPDRATMGTLNFTFYEFRFISSDACLVTGRYRLKRANDEPTGMFTLLIRKIEGKWLIVYDHTS
jgi:uncharacterized protein (TIGR02246 family)